MSRSAAAWAPEWTNPFSTHLVRPGAREYQFPDGVSPNRILWQLQQDRWRGQIVGPHGTGKTTLLRTLDPYWGRWGRVPLAVSLRNRQRFLPRLPWETFSERTQLIVDGYEQLGILERLRLAYQCWRRRCGLLVTTHRPTSVLSIVHQTAADPQLVRKLAQDLLVHSGMSDASLFNEFLDPPDQQSLVEVRFEQAQGNVRETWMLLFDDAEKVFRREQLTS